MDSFIRVEDAAAATVAALESDRGIYNIVDDDPSEMGVWLPAFARFVAAPPPPHVTEQQAQALGPGVVYYATRLRGARNDLAKRKLGFSPRRLEWLSKATMQSGAGPISAGKNQRCHPVWAQAGRHGSLLDCIQIFTEAAANATVEMLGLWRNSIGCH